MELTITIAILLVAGIIIGAIGEYKEHEVFLEWEQNAINDFGITHKDFLNYMDIAQELYGENATPLDAYYIAEEEYYDLNYK